MTSPEKNTQPEEQTFNSFAEFYPFYIAEHSNPICRALHYIGSFGVLAIVAYVMLTGNLKALWIAPIFGYGFAWDGHFFFEHNRPATFKYPFYSFMGDWVMLKDFLLGRFRNS